MRIGESAVVLNLRGKREFESSDLPIRRTDQLFPPLASFSQSALGVMPFGFERKRPQEKSRPRGSGPLRTYYALDLRVSAYQIETKLPHPGVLLVARYLAAFSGSGHSFPLRRRWIRQNLLEAVGVPKERETKDKRPKTKDQGPGTKGWRQDRASRASSVECRGRSDGRGWQTGGQTSARIRLNSTLS